MTWHGGHCYFRVGPSRLIVCARACDQSHSFFASQPWVRVASLDGRRRSRPRQRPPALVRILSLRPTPRRPSTPSSLHFTTGQILSILHRFRHNRRSYRCHPTKASCRTTAITKKPTRWHSKHRTKDLFMMDQRPSRMMATQSLPMTRFATLYKRWRKPTSFGQMSRSPSVWARNVQGHM